MIRNLLLIFCLFLFSWTIGYSQVNIQVGNTYTQDFDGIGTSATATLPSGWKASKNTNVRSVDSYSSAVTKTEQSAGNNMSSSAANGIYNFGAGPAASATDRAVGGISSGTASKSVNVYVDLYNNGATTIDALNIKYDAEKYRKGTNVAGFSIRLFYSTDGSNWTEAIDFAASFAGSDADNNGYAPAPGATISVDDQLTVSIAASSHLYLAWNYSVTSGTTTSNAQSLGVDNISIEAVASGGGCTPPTTFPSNLTVGNESTSTLDVSWDNTTGDNIIVLARKGSAVNADPANGTVYTANAVYGTVGTEIGTGNYVVYIGTGEDVTVTGLEEGTNYYFKAYSFDNGTNCYNTTNTASGNGTTSVSPPCYPSTYPTDLTTSNATTTTMDATWTNSAPDDIIVLAHAGSAVDADPVNGQTYFGNAAFGSGSQIGTGNFVVYIGNGTTVNVTGLTASTTYYFKAYSYNASLCYNTVNPASGSGMTTSPSAGDYKTVDNGAWEDKDIWEYSTDGMNWGPAVQAPSSTDGTITVNHNVTFNANRTVDQLTIAGGAELEVVAGTLTVADGAGTDLVVNGTLKYTGGNITMSSGANGEVNANGTYDFNNGSKSVETIELTWNTGSTFLVSKNLSTSNGISSTMGTKVFHHFVWNSTTQGVTINFQGIITKVNGDFKLLNTNGQKIRLSSSGNYNMTVEGDLIINSGAYLELSNGSPTSSNLIVKGNLNNSGQLCLHAAGQSSSNPGRLEVKGNIISGGIIQSAGTNSNNKVVLNGSGLQHLAASSIKPYFSNQVIALEINNAAGVELSGNVNIEGDVLFTDGFVYTNKYRFYQIAGNITQDPQGDYYFVTSDADGTFHGEGGLTRNVKNMGNIFFPVGPATDKFMPTTVTLTTNTEDRFTARVVPLESNEVVVNTGKKPHCVQHQWEIDHEVGTGSAKLKLQWASGTEGSSFAPSGNLYIGHWKYPETEEDNGYFDVIMDATYDSDDPSAESVNAFSSFSPFVVASEFTALPVNWLDVSATKEDRYVLIKWKTTAESNMRNYEIERRNANGGFDKLGEVNPYNSPTINNYSFVDTRPNLGANYYRIRQVDKNGMFSYSKVVQANFGSDLSFHIQNYGQQSFGFVGVDNVAILKVYDTNGRLLLTKHVTRDSREALEGFANGSYALTLEEGDRFFSTMFMLSR